MKRLGLFTFISVILPVFAIACGNNGSSAEAQNIGGGEGWKEIAPTDIKNAVRLFDKDWMALAAGKEGDMNAMTISWGGIGELWGKPVVTVYVSTDRYTHSFMERNEYSFVY